MSAVEIRAPAEQTEGTRSQLLRWLKRPGERVAQNEPLIEIETDKVTVEVASPATGVLREILKHEQEEIAPGELLGRLECEGGAAAGAAAAGRDTGSTPAPAATAPGTGASRAPADGAATSPAVAPAGADSAPLSPAVRRLLAEHGLSADAVRAQSRAAQDPLEG